MFDTLKNLFLARRQTIYYIIMFVIYAVVIIWTTLQSYARLEYSRTGSPEQIQIQQKHESQ